MGSGFFPWGQRGSPPSGFDLKDSKPVLSPDNRRGLPVWALKKVKMVTDKLKHWIRD
jgi:hypothetical protein